MPLTCRSRHLRMRRPLAASLGFVQGSCSGCLQVGLFSTLEEENNRFHLTNRTALSDFDLQCLKSCSNLHTLSLVQADALFSSFIFCRFFFFWNKFYCVLPMNKVGGSQKITSMKFRDFQKAMESQSRLFSGTLQKHQERSPVPSASNCFARHVVLWPRRRSRAAVTQGPTTAGNSFHEPHRLCQVCSRHSKPSSLSPSNLIPFELDSLDPPHPPPTNMLNAFSSQYSCAISVLFLSQISFAMSFH